MRGTSELLPYLSRRLLQILPVLLLVSFLTFFISYKTPGDPARLLLGQRASQEQIAQVRDQLGLNDPFLVQYGRYMGKVVRGDLGRSYAKKGMGVGEIIAEKFSLTMRLAILATLFSAIVGVTAGVLSALRPYSLLDFGSMLLALLGVSLPAFFLGFLLIVFVARPLGLPVGGYADETLLQQFRHLLLPAIVLGSLTAAVVARLTRSAMLEVLGQDYVRTARAKGLPERRVVLRHALRNAAIPIVTVIGNNFGGLLVGAVLTESVFGLPGLGREIVQAIGQRDRELIAGGVLFMAVIFVTVNLLVDLTYAVFDPRVRYE
jgi:peptide/nickel transport system permease protein